MYRMRRIKRCIRFISEVRLVKEYKYLGMQGGNHVFEGKREYYLIAVTQENFNKAMVGKAYGLSVGARKGSIKQLKER